ncbi:MAG: DUF4271 domain-containing protein [Flavobacteriales bacterium]
MEPSLVIRPDISLSEEWVLPFLLLVLLVTAYVRVNFPSRIQKVWRGYFNVRFRRQSMREESNVPKEYFLFHVVFAILFALIIFGALKHFHINVMGLSGILLYICCIGAVIGVYTLKLFSYRFLAFLSAGDFSLGEFQYVTFLGLRFLVFFFFPLNFLLFYLPQIYATPILLLAFILFVINYLYRLITGFTNALNAGVGVFYIFFYICTLEILPLLVSYKALAQ